MEASNKLPSPGTPGIWSWIILCYSVQSLSCVRLFATPWTAACQASLSITNSELTQTHVH